MSNGAKDVLIFGAKQKFSTKYSFCWKMKITAAETFFREQTTFSTCEVKNI